MKTLLFVGHPGHELLAYSFLKRYKPSVVFLTKGSGNDNKSRLNQSINLVNSLGLEVYFPFEPITDRQIYNLILSNSVDFFLNIKNELKNFILDNNIEAVFGDALEGFNPSHDLCRYLTNSVVMSLQSKVLINNYDFLLDNVIKNITSEKREDDIVLKLNKEKFEEKVLACDNYPELKTEVDRFSAKYGRDLFSTEFFRKINNPKQIKNWDTKHPYYEEFGKKRVIEGVYNQIISFENHMKPLAQILYKN